jgi:hypothetical protein
VYDVTGANPKPVFKVLAIYSRETHKLADGLVKRIDPVRIIFVGWVGVTHLALDHHFTPIAETVMDLTDVLHLEGITHCVPP